VGHGPELAQVEVPLKSFARKFVFFNALHEQVVTPYKTL
jgi:hypothetical protein